jgi:hypothetical protein
MWLWLLNNLVTNLNTKNVLCATFGLYPSYAAVTLNSVKVISFYVICYERINYAEHIKRFIAEKECTLKIFDENSYLLTSGCDTVLLSFEARLIHGQLPSGLIFAQSALRGVRL